MQQQWRTARLLSFGVVVRSKFLHLRITYMRWALTILGTLGSAARDQYTTSNRKSYYKARQKYDLLNTAPVRHILVGYETMQVAVGFSPMFFPIDPDLTLRVRVHYCSSRALNVTLSLRLFIIRATILNILCP